MKMKSAAVVLSVLVLSGCAITQNVVPVAKFEGKEVCIIENTRVRAGFLESYKSALTAKGFTANMLPASATAGACPVLSNYTANWLWDGATYMAYAEINVLKNGEPAGKAVYDSRSGGANLGKFINADTKIRELVDQLYPAATASAP